MTKFQHNYDDETPMPFGAHRNTILAKIPDNYFRFLWNDGLNCRCNDDTPAGGVARYIHSALSELGQKHVMKEEGKL